MENYYPVFVDLRGQKCLVVGGGEVASRKVKQLLKCRAAVSVVSPAVVSYLHEVAEIGWITWLREEYNSRYLDGAVLVIGATSDAGVNSLIARDCRNRNILVNIVDIPELCSFIVPSVVSRGPLSIAISTEGKSPAFARQVREELEEQFTETHGAFLSFLGGLRAYIQEEVSDEQERKALFWELSGSEFYKLYQNLSQEVLEEIVAGMVARGRTRE